MSIVYLDPVNDELRELISSLNGTNRDIYFASDYEGEKLDNLLEEASYFVVATVPVNKSHISKAKKLKHIQKTGIGVDNIDLKEASKRGITVSNTPGANATGVAELTILLMLALYRKLPILNEETKSGDWPMWKYRLSSYELEEKIHGIIGFGKIGQEVAKRSKAFGTNIVYYDVQRASIEVEKSLEVTYLSKEELLRKADIVSLHIPYIPETKDFIHEAELNQMKETAILINVSRGGIVNEDALVKAIQNGKILGAGIDVWTSEPPEKNHPLFQLPQVIATPHIGAGTKDTLIRVLNIAFQNIKQVDKGEEPNYIVNSVKK